MRGKGSRVMSAAAWAASGQGLPRNGRPCHAGLQPPSCAHRLRLSRRFKEAVNECSVALDTQPNFFKALVRRGKAYEQMGLFKQVGAGRARGHGGRGHRARPECAARAERPWWACKRLCARGRRCPVASRQQQRHGRLEPAAGWASCCEAHRSHSSRAGSCHRPAHAVCRPHHTT